MIMGGIQLEGACIVVRQVITHRGQATEEVLVGLGIYELGGTANVKSEQGDARDCHLSKGVGHILQGRCEYHQHALLI